MKVSIALVALSLFGFTLLAAAPAVSAADAGICAGPVKASGDCYGQLKVCPKHTSQILCINGPVQCIREPCPPF